MSERKYEIFENVIHFIHKFIYLPFFFIWSKKECQFKPNKTLMELYMGRLVTILSKAGQVDVILYAVPIILLLFYNQMGKS